MLIPQEKLIEMQDKMGSTPAQADAFIEAVGVMYDWAKKRNLVSSNPAKGIDKVYIKGDGAIPWKADDVKSSSPSISPGAKRTLPCPSCYGLDAVLKISPCSAERMNAS